MNRLRTQLMETSPEKDFERIHKLMPLVPPAALHDFLLQYASEHADFRKLWRDWLEARFMPRGNSADDLRKSVAAVFNSTPVLPDTHGPWGEDDCLDWEMLGGSMRQLMKNAADAPPDATLAMAFEFMRQLDAHNDMELSDDGWMEVEEIAYQLLDKITAYIRNGDVPIAGRRAALDQLGTSPSCRCTARWDCAIWTTCLWISALPCWRPTRPCACWMSRLSMRRKSTGTGSFCANSSCWYS